MAVAAALVLAGGPARAQQALPPPTPGAAPIAPAASGPPGAAPPAASGGAKRNDAFCEPGLEIRCSCGQGLWEKTRCRDDGTNWEFCPCPEPDRPEQSIDHGRPSARSTGLIASGVALTTLGATALGVASALRAAGIPECAPTADNCVEGWIGVAGAGLVLTATGVPLWAVGAARVHADERPRNTPLMIGGGLAAGLGMIALARGVTTVALGDAHGWAPIAAGGAGLVGGVALTIYGGWEVPDVPSDEHVGLAIVVSPRSASLQGRF